jgi:acyl phosphate:glycerol-3-phosphate acyltransferase
VILSIFLVVLAYLMGSVCSAVIVCKLSSLPDPRLEGSKNPGATNVLRIAGKQYAAIVMLADVLKGTIPVLIAKLLGADAATIGYTALAAVLGHMYPIFFDFKGGKGVATAIGALLGFQFMVGTLVVATWLLVARIFRYSSLASIIAIGFSPFYSLMIVQRAEIFPPLCIIALLVLYKHRDNMMRIVDKKEPKIKFNHPILEDIVDHPHDKPVAHKKTTAKVEEVEIETVTVSEKVVVTPKPKATPKVEKAAKTTTKAKTTGTKTVATKKSPVKKTSKPKDDKPQT